VSAADERRLPKLHPGALTDRPSTEGSKARMGSKIFVTKDDGRSGGGLFVIR
jgi:hypothetical protein